MKNLKKNWKGLVPEYFPELTRYIEKQFQYDVHKKAFRQDLMMSSQLPHRYYIRDLFLHYYRQKISPSDICGWLRQTFSVEGNEGVSPYEDLISKLEQLPSELEGMMEGFVNRDPIIERSLFDLERRESDGSHVMHIGSRRVPLGKHDFVDYPPSSVKLGVFLPFLDNAIRSLSPEQQGDFVKHCVEKDFFGNDW